MSEGEEPEQEEGENSASELRNVVVDDDAEETDAESESERLDQIECCYFSQDEEESRKNDLRSLNYSKMKDQNWVKKDFAFLNGKKITRASPLPHDFIGNEVKILLLLANKFCPESPLFKLPEETLKHIFKFAPECGNDLYLELDGKIPFLIGFRKTGAEFFDDVSGTTYLDVVVYKIPRKLVVQPEEVAFIFVMSFLCAVICGLITVIVVELV